MTAQQDTGKRGGSSSLKDIFPESYCRTLFLPATSSRDLKNLDQLDRADLTKDYQRDLAAVVAHLRDSLLRQKVDRLRACPTLWLLLCVPPNVALLWQAETVLSLLSGLCGWRMTLTAFLVFVGIV